MKALDFLAVGHLTRDLLLDGTTTAGGTSLYASCVAARQGLQAAVLTAGKTTSGVEPGVAVVNIPAGVDTTFENRVGPAGRVQRLHGVAPGLSEAALTSSLRWARMVLLGPVADEVDPALAWAFDEGALIAATPQGWMRVWDEPLPSAVRRRPWAPPEGLLARLSLLVVSREDVGGDESLAASYAASCPLVALTRGNAGATLFVRGTPHAIAPHPAVERDPTGAGDVFAATLLVRLGEGVDPIEAARSAARAAAAAVEGPGTSSIPRR